MILAVSHAGKCQQSNEWNEQSVLVEEKKLLFSGLGLFLFQV